MDHRCLRAAAHIDTFSAIRLDACHQTSNRQHLESAEAQHSQPRVDEPSTAALVAVIVGALIVGVIVVALARMSNKTQAAVPSQVTHLCHLEGNLLMRCDNDL